MEEMRELFNYRFGWGTWKEIVQLRSQQRIKEEKERLEELKRSNEKARRVSRETHDCNTFSTYYICRHWSLCLHVCQEFWRSTLVSCT